MLTLDPTAMSTMPLVSSPSDFEVNQLIEDAKSSTWSATPTRSSASGKDVV
jgi:hypothetical protein